MGSKQRERRDQVQGLSPGNSPTLDREEEEPPKVTKKREAHGLEEPKEHAAPEAR